MFVNALTEQGGRAIQISESARPYATPGLA